MTKEVPRSRCFAGAQLESSYKKQKFAQMRYKFLFLHSSCFFDHAKHLERGT